MSTSGLSLGVAAQPHHEKQCFCLKHAQYPTYSSISLSSINASTKPGSCILTTNGTVSSDEAARQNARIIMSAPIAQALWDARIPLHITHPAAPNTPFITSIPRFSYLALLLPRLSAFFNTPCSSFHFENVLLRNLAVGLLVDLYQPSLPWRLVVNDGVSWDISDTFLNAAKEVTRNSLCPFPTVKGLTMDACKQAEFFVKKRNS